MKRCTYSCIFIFILLVTGIVTASTEHQLVCSASLLCPHGKDTTMTLTDGWKFQSGDNSQWADPNFDDTEWDTTSVFLTENASESSISLTGTGWFRKHLEVDSNYLNIPMALLALQVGATEIYVDGKLIARYGEFIENDDDIISIHASHSKPEIFEFSESSPHVIAIRHSAGRASHFLKNDKANGFTISIGKAQPVIEQVQKIITLVKSHQIFFTTVSLSFALIHFLLFVFYPGRRENLYFSILTIGFAGLSYCPFQLTFESSLGMYSFYFIAFKISLIVVSISGLRMLFTFFYYQTPKSFWILGVAGVCMSLMSWYFPLNYYYVAAFFSMCIGIYLLTCAIFCHKRGAVLIGVGYLLFTIGSAIQILAETQIIPNWWGIHQPYMLGILGMLVFMSIHLARDFARKSIALRNKLIEVKELSQKTIEQERHSKEQEMKQKLLETELQYQAKQLNKAEELKKAHTQLEQAHYKLRTTQTQLIQSEKMASLGNLVAGVAHEINTPIGAVGSMHNTLERAVSKIHGVLEDSASEEEYCSKKEINKYLSVIDDANKVITSGVERVSSIVKKLRSFARLDEAELKRVNIHEGLDDTLALIRHETKHGITVLKNYGNIPDIPCFPGQLNQVFLNLLVNACQAMGGKGEITIITKLQDEHVFITIIDRGPGISEENIGRIFDPGYTTKGVGVGTGLGLSICYQIIKDHMGEIKVSSRINEGTTFSIILPTKLDKLLEEKKANNSQSK
ncbi:MAG: hypothetical protein KAR42_08335 [candidate division Zixibacteria bacterium]|nr:hypothetical protein [candidate division Zixibacteria bacterium]